MSAVPSLPGAARRSTATALEPRRTAPPAALVPAAPPAPCAALPGTERERLLQSAAPCSTGHDPSTQNFRKDLSDERFNSNTDFCMIRSVKTTLDIDDELLARAKATAAREHSTLTALVEEGLRLRIQRRRRAPAGIPARIAVYAGHGGLAPGVDPLSNHALNDAADDA